jgi:NAD(P)H-hydrate epimerase
MRLLNATQMREADRRTIESAGVPSLMLMEAAGRHVASVIEAAFPALASSRVAVVCGRGNNGGDGFVVARRLAERGVAVVVCLAGRKAEVKGDALTNLTALGNRGIAVAEVVDAPSWSSVRERVIASDVIVDALFGTGLGHPLGGFLAGLVEDLNAAGKPIVSIDLPSGLSADTSEVIGPAVRATITVTLGALKVPLVLPPASALAGRVEIADIGIPPDVIASLPEPCVEMSTAAALRPLIKPRKPDAHKGDFGHVLVVAGSRGKTGAAYLSAMGALRSGAGLVTIATPASCVPIVAALGAEFMTLPLAETVDGMVAHDALDAALAADVDVMAVGPGLGRSRSTAAFVHGILERAEVPLVLDADALNACAEPGAPLRGRPDRPVIVTPHPGEMARLLGTSAAIVQCRRLESAKALAADRHLHVILKGRRTIIAAPGGLTTINSTGNPGMATGGTGDVLTGMVAAWLAVLGDPAEAARLAAYLHGHAGDLAAASVGEVALVAGDILAHLGRAVLDLAGPVERAHL